jgi:cytochrome c
MKGFPASAIAFAAMLAAPAMAAELDKMKVGSELFANSDCITCHAIDKKMVGPTLKDVAAKYRGDTSAEDRLVEKVIKGGGGVWGTAAELPHPNMKEEDIRALVQWILAQ